MSWKLYTKDRTSIFMKNKNYRNKEWLTNELLDKTPLQIAKEEGVDDSTITKWICRLGITNPIRRQTFKLHCFDCRALYFSKGRKKARDGRYRCRKCQSKYHAQKTINRYKQKTIYRGKYKEASRKWVLENYYNISVSDYDNMLKTQKERCKICKVKTKLVVDHCHTKGHVRGLLCNKCNRALGSFHDNIEILENAIQYLRETNRE